MTGEPDAETLAFLEALDAEEPEPEALTERHRRQALAFRDRQVPAEPAEFREWTGMPGEFRSAPEPRGDPEWQAGVLAAVDGRLVTFLEPEDRGTAALSALGETEYAADLIRPGRIVVVGAEEGAGKSYSIDSELGIRVAVAGGAFAGTWDIVQTGAVCYLSEMHADDDYDRETTVLDSLHLDRAALTGRYYRLPLMTAAGGRPCLTVPAWRDWFTGWARDHGLLLAVFDTGTGATQVDPWGREIQAVFTNLRAMLESYPALAIALLVHLRKPQGHGERRLSDVLGEWARWCDVVVLLERDGDTRTKVTVRKRVRHERRIAATKAGGLLIDPVDLDEAKSTKVPADAVLAAIVAAPGIDYLRLGKVLGVSKDTAANYARALEEAGLVETRTERRATARGTQRLKVVYAVSPGTEAPNGAERASSAPVRQLDGAESRRGTEAPNEPYRGSVPLLSAPEVPPAVQAALDVFGDDVVEPETGT
ncbi:MAG: hypothetical protein ACLQHS_08375 [Candidatus Limnocylindrales bacterium]